MSEKSRANPSSPTVPQVFPLLQAVYARHCAGCCAHIVTDDGNVEQESAEFCLQRAQERGHPDCLALCEALVLMTPTQRHKLYGHPDKRALDPELRNP